MKIIGDISLTGKNWKKVNEFLGISNEPHDVFDSEVPCHDKHYRWVMEQGKAKERQRQVRNRLAKGPKPETTVACLVAYARRLLK